MGLQGGKRVQSAKEVQMLPERHLPDDRVRVHYKSTLRYNAHYVHNTCNSDDVAHANRALVGLEIDGENGHRRCELDLPYDLYIRFTLAVTSQWYQSS